nr:hypothetical protein [Tanacetum cinerariifolium]
MELTVFLLPSDEKVGIEVSAVDLQVSAVRLILLLSIKNALTVNPNIYVSCIKKFWTSVAVKKVNDVMRLQALVNKKKVIITEATIREAIRLDDAEGVECFPNEEIFVELSRMGYEKPSTKLTFYKVAGGADEVHDKGVPAVGIITEGDVRADNDEVHTADEDHLFHLLHHLLYHLNHLKTRVKHLEQDKVAQALEITKLKSRVKKLERRNKASKIKRLKKVGSAQRIDTLDDTVIDDDVAANAKDGQDDDIDESDDIQGRTIDTTITAANVPFPAATTVAAPTLTIAPSRRRKGVEPKPLKKQAQIEQDEKYARELEAELNRNIDWDEVIDHVQRKQKEYKSVKRYQALKRKPQTEPQARKNMMVYLKNIAGFKMDYFNGISFDDIHPIFEKHFDSNVAFLQNTKEQMDEDDSRALKRLNESKEENAAKKQKLDVEVEELKRHLQIMPNDEDDVYTEATPLAQKVPVVDYEIYNESNKPYYKIKRADNSHQLYLSFLSLLRNFDRENLEALWSLVREIFATTKPKNFFDDILLITLGAMFEKPDIHA